ncbi:MAG: glutamate formiminotransferase, partial [Acidimicrobiia bacterium]|nr:glutamate formiminotransferase [Acidimicrobiia bacterium]
MLECVINISEGGNPGQLSDLSSELGPDLLDLHSDADHNRSVFT